MRWRVIAALLINYKLSSFPVYCAPQVLDGSIYEQVKDYLVSLCQMELESYQVVHNTFNILLESSNGVSARKLAQWPYVSSVSKER